MMFKTMHRICVLLLCISSAIVHSSEMGRWRLLNPIQAYTVRLNPLDCSKLYVGNWANQLYRSDDGGNSWYIAETGPLSAINYLSSVHIPKSDTSVICVGGFRFNGIKTSTNSGASFRTVLNDAAQRNMWFISEAITESIDGTLYAARGSTYHSVWRSTDNGRTWDSIAVVSDEASSRVLCTITAHPSVAGLLFIGATHGRIFRSADGGFTWSRVPVLNGVDSVRPHSEIPKITFSTTNPDRGFAVVTQTDTIRNNGDGGLLATEDGGQTWNRIAFTDTSFWAVSVRPLPSGTDEITVGGFRLMSIPPSVYVGDSLVFRSLDNGETWQRYSNIPWQANELGDTIRNVWSLTVCPQTGRMFMGTTVGIYVLDEGSSAVFEDQSKITGLNIRIRQTDVVVHDSRPLLSDRTWKVFDMSARLVCSGTITNPSEQRISIPDFVNGTYLLLWGSDRNFRTLPFQISR